MSKPDPKLAAAALDLVHREMAKREGLIVIGVCGSQASGKSTVSRWLVDQLEGEGTAAATLSLDDIYSTKAERRALAVDVHPLLITRGVPGTHDVELGIAVIDALQHGKPAPLPRFEKARDDRAAPEDWPLAPAACRVLIFEGWCVGAKPQPNADLLKSLNELEAIEDPDGTWRDYANAHLAGEYQRLFDRLDALILLAAPSFAVVAGWRLQQEQDLASTGLPLMDKAAVERFVSHYERLTNWILAEMPTRADLVAQLDQQRRVVSIG